MTDDENKQPVVAEAIKQHLNLETGKLSWPELSRYFARGVVIVVDKQLDLIDVAAKMVVDDKAAIANLLETQQMVRALDRHAQKWQDEDTLFWSVVVAPWVLVQEMSIQ